MIKLCSVSSLSALASGLVLFASLAYLAEVKVRSGGNLPVDRSERLLVGGIIIAGVSVTMFVVYLFVHFGGC